MKFVKQVLRGSKTMAKPALSAVLAIQIMFGATVALVGSTPSAFAQTPIPGTGPGCRGACMAFVAKTQTKMPDDVVERASYLEKIRFLTFLHEKYPGDGYKGIRRGELRQFGISLTKAKDAKAYAESIRGLDDPRLWEGALSAAASGITPTPGASLQTTLAGGLIAGLGHLDKELALNVFRQYAVYRATGDLGRLQGGLNLWSDRPLSANKLIARAHEIALKDPEFAKQFNEQIAGPAGLPPVGQSQDYYLADNPVLNQLLTRTTGINLEAELQKTEVKEKLGAIIKENMQANFNESINERNQVLLNQHVQQRERMIYAGANVIESTLNLTGNSRDARLFSTAFNGAMELRKNMADLQASLQTIKDMQAIGTSMEKMKQAQAIANMSGAIMTFNVIAVGMALASSFMDKGPDPQAVILQQLGMIAEAIQTMRKEMHQRFDAVDAKLDALMDTVERGFRELAKNQTWTLLKVGDLSVRLVDEAKRRETQFSATELFSKLKTGAITAAQFANYDAAKLTASEAIKRAEYLYNMSELSIQPIYRNYTGGTQDGHFDFVVKEYFLSKINPRTAGQGVLTSRVFDAMGAVFDAYEGISGDSSLSDINTPNFKMWSWAATEAVDLYAKRSDSEPRGSQWVKSLYSTPSTVSGFLGLLREHGARYEKLAQTFTRNAASKQSPLHRLLEAYEATIFDEVLPKIRESARAEAIHAIKEHSTKIETGYLLDAKNNRVKRFCEAAGVSAFDPGVGGILARTNQWPAASIEAIDAQMEYFALNSIMKQPTEPLCTYQQFRVVRQTPVNSAAAFPGGYVNTLTHVARTSGITGSFNAIRNNAWLSKKANLDLGVRLNPVGVNVTNYQVAMNVGGRNIEEYFVLHEAGTGYDWTEFNKYLSRIGQYVPTSSTVMGLDTISQARLDRILSYLGTDFRQKVLAQVATRIRTELEEGTSPLARAVAKAGYYKHALRVALEFSAGPAMDRRDWLYLKLNGPDGMIDSVKLAGTFSSAESLTQALLANSKSSIKADKTPSFKCQSLSDSEAVIDLNCLAAEEFAVWAKYTNAAETGKPARPGAALFGHLTDAAKSDFFDPGNLIFADQKELISQISEQISKMQPSDLGTAMPVRAMNKRIDQTIQTRKSWF
ncbi:MAG: hypothetical protein ABL958_02850 [Bdellovibrionia bacterium]